MKPRVFVVMPFGKKRRVEMPAKHRDYEAKAVGNAIDFDAVYDNLLEPALRQAGCDPFRADSEASAGDIRTDMFFELVTADLVVADISIANPNVFYELGVRHGVCPRGVLVVQGSFGNARPFDVAPDRCFSYDGSLFVDPKPGSADLDKDLEKQVELLSQTFKQALAEEHKTTGSPVYQHLPGLIPVNWDNIETSRANYFGALRDDWLDCVRIAQSNGHPGDIKTLADDAPTILHRTKILYQAALALIDLCRYRAAERELREVIEHDPNHFEAQLQLSRVLTHQGKTAQAELHLRNVLRQHKDDPHAGDLLGQVFRHLWHLSWRDEKPERRKEKAVETSQQAALAVRSFIQAQQFDPSAYFAGFNALILIAVLKDLRQSMGCDLAEIWPADVDEAELATVVQFCAKNFRERAIEKGDPVEQFWTTTTLAGLALIRNDNAKALQRIREACSIPGATFFQLRSFQERLLLYDELDFRPDLIKPALHILCEALTQKNRHRTWRRVFLWAGYPVDKEDQRTARFPVSSVGAVRAQIEEALDQWQVGKEEGDLAICEGVHEGDIMFAEACHKRKAQVRLLLLKPSCGQFHRALWPFQSGEWERRFHELRAALGDEVWFHSEHLGAAFDEGTPEGRKSLQRRHKNWLINTAKLEAEPHQTCGEQPDSAPRLFGLFLWNGKGDGDNPEDPSYFVRLVDEFNGYQGQVRTIDALAAPADAQHYVAIAG